MPRFVIGIGSQRAGSTLLHRILDDCTPVMMHPVKELHYFDTKFRIRDPRVLKEFSSRQLDRELDDFVTGTKPTQFGAKKSAYLRANWMLASRDIDDVEYADLFRPFQPDAVLGEITPEYMLLRESQIEYMAEVVGAEAKIILIRRDPVDRFVSAFKLLKMYGGGTIDSERFSDELVATLSSMPTWVDQQIQLNNYPEAEAQFRRHFGSVLVLDYRAMSADPGGLARDLEAFLELPVNADAVREKLAVRVNAIGETGEVTDEALVTLKQRIGVA
ncbi:MAG: sulfotransferase [Pseudoclavibacter sp.]